jgi:hypothetical protein
MEIETPGTWVHHPLAAPGWLELIEALRAFRLRCLDIFCVEGLFANLDLFVEGMYVDGSKSVILREARVHDYILHGYGPNPVGPDRDAVANWDAELW